MRKCAECGEMVEEGLVDANDIFRCYPCYWTPKPKVAAKPKVQKEIKKVRPRVDIDG